MLHDTSVKIIKLNTVTHALFCLNRVETSTNTERLPYQNKLIFFRFSESGTFYRRSMFPADPIMVANSVTSHSQFVCVRVYCKNVRTDIGLITAFYCLFLGNRIIMLMSGTGQHFGMCACDV